MDEELEYAIDKAGRNAVFNRAAALGWGTGTPPPKWVWWQIVEEVKQGAPLPYDTKPIHEQVLGFRLF